MIIGIVLIVFVLALLGVVYFTEMPSFIIGSVYGMYRHGYDRNWMSLLQAVAFHESGDFYKTDKDSPYRKHNNYIGMQEISSRKNSSSGNVSIQSGYVTRTIAKYSTPAHCATDFYHWLNMHKVTKKNSKQSIEQNITQGVEFMKSKTYFVEDKTDYTNGCLYWAQQKGLPWNADYWVLGALAALFIALYLELKGLLFGRK